MRSGLGKWFFTAVVSGGLFCASLVLLYTAYVSTQLPAPSQLGARRAVESTKIYDRTGKILLYEIHGEENRTVVPFSKISPFVKSATLAAEDANFYSQPGFDWKAIVRAFIVNLRRGEWVQGGSTITQQLAKNVFLSPEKTLTRKLKEVALALQLEKKFSKDEIFEMYLNQVPYGSNAYGIEAASQTFFSKSAKDLTLAESAALASLPKAPSYYSPWGAHAADLTARKDAILRRMRALGFITEDDLTAALAEKINFVRKPSAIKAYHFSLAVRDYLIAKYGEEIVTNGGLRVITTLDWDLQEMAERAVENGVARNSELYKGYNGALVAEDPRTGDVLALVGSRDPFGEPLPAGCTPGVDCRFEPSFNVALQGLRQPGSALKPFAYLTAFDKGFRPETILFDVPTEFTAGDPACPALVDFKNQDSRCFHPHNFDEQFHGPVSLARGLSNSMNVVSVKTLYLAGFDDVLKKLAQFGITTLGDRGRYGLSLVLGGGEVRLSELVGAYAALAEEGVFYESGLVLSVHDAAGRKLEERDGTARRVEDSLYTRMITNILADQKLRSTLFGASLGLTIFEGRDVALKTGTTNDYRDAWALGYTPSLVVGVWAGNNDNTPMERRGGSILAAVPIWSEFMRGVLPKYAPEFFPPRPAAEAVLGKPMLNGQYIYNLALGEAKYPQVHTILHYVDKRNPAGGFPANPYSDPQYEKWEFSVIRWAEANVPGFAANYNKPVPAGAVWEQTTASADGISIDGVLPLDGSFVQSPFRVRASVISREELKTITLYLNEVLVAHLPVGSKAHNFSWQLYNELKGENVLELIVTDQAGREKRRKWAVLTGGT